MTTATSNHPLMLNKVTGRMDLHPRIEQLTQRIEPLRRDLLHHSIYERLNSISALRRFMEHHIYAVWDFMSLLKSLQRQLTCVNVPWVPVANATHARLVNEIVLAEESDEDGEGGFASHFELYYRSMQHCGADTQGIDALISQLRSGADLECAITAAAMPDSARQFVRCTMSLIASGDPCRIAAAFTFGREDLLPDVFQQIVEQLDVDDHRLLSPFRYYLNRHIELDGDEHGPMAQRLVIELCGDDKAKWMRAEQAAVDSLIARKKLWDEMLKA
ncbi:MAG: DUF3050 domain-containing protein [Pirellula sp.]